MGNCDHRSVYLSHWNGDAGAVRCEDCGAFKIIEGLYEWVEENND
jgi:hypothetical protein